MVLKTISIITSYPLRISFASHMFVQPLFNGYLDKCKGGSKKYESRAGEMDQWVKVSVAQV